MKQIVKMTFGSHLYGTNTPESDLDYKGVFFPTKEEIFLGKIPKSVNLSTNKTPEKNTPNDVDTEIYSLHYFLKLACAGETIALDMIHAPKRMILVHSQIWAEIVQNRKKFYTKNLKAFVGYARRQAAKYGIKGSRLNDAKRVLDFLEPLGDTPLRDYWDNLPVGEHIHKHPARPENNNLRMYQVCGRQAQETARASYVADIVRRFHDNYGARARKAAENKGIDWKAVSHAVRAAHQIKELLTKNTITFPRPEARLLIEIKQGKLHFQREVGPMLDGLMDEVEALSQKSTLPEKANYKFWNQFIINTIEKSLL